MSSGSYLLHIYIFPPQIFLKSKSGSNRNTPYIQYFGVGKWIKLITNRPDSAWAYR